MMDNLKGITVEKKKGADTEETISEGKPEKVYVVKTERSKWALAKDDGNGWAGEILTEGGGDYYPVPLNGFKGIQEASFFAKKHFPDSEVVIVSNI